MKHVWVSTGRVVEYIRMGGGGVFFAGALVPWRILVQFGGWGCIRWAGLGWFGCILEHFGAVRWMGLYTLGWFGTVWVRFGAFWCSSVDGVVYVGLVWDGLGAF